MRLDVESLHGRYANFILKPHTLGETLLTEYWKLASHQIQHETTAKDFSKIKIRAFHSQDGNLPYVL